jgi:hypothetical protein
MDLEKRFASLELGQCQRVISCWFCEVTELAIKFLKSDEQVHDKFRWAEAINSPCLQKSAESAVEFGARILKFCKCIWWRNFRFVAINLKAHKKHTQKVPTSALAV